VEAATWEWGRWWLKWAHRSGSGIRSSEAEKMLLQRVENDIGSIVDNFSHLVNVSQVIFPYFIFFLFLIYIRSCGCIFQKLPSFLKKKKIIYHDCLLLIHVRMLQ
jgi:hypothetical protein